MTSHNHEKIFESQLRPQLHALRQSAFYQAVQQHQLTRDSFIAYLRSLSLFHAFFESSAELGMRQLVQRFEPGMRLKLPLIRQDLNALHAGVGPDLVEPARLSYELVRQMRLKSLHTPVRGLGYLGAVEAIRLVMQEFVPALMEKFPAALAHLETPLIATEGLIRSFLAQFPQDEKAEPWSSLVDAARELLSGFKAIVDACHPAEGRKRQFLATTLNPEAGLHLITQKEEEIQVAIAVGNKLLEQMPYMSRRYGERARYFVYSDAAWQIHLTQLSHGAMLDQMQWLAKLLALKGMPTYTIVVKLIELEAELTKMNPAEAVRYQKLGTAARFFEEQSRRRLSPALQEVLMQQTFHTLEPELGESFQHILASAVIDELNGYRGAELAMKTWLEQSPQLSSRFKQASLRMIQKLKTSHKQEKSRDQMV